MGKRKSKGNKAAQPESQTDSDVYPTGPSFPFASYISVVGVHTTLLAFTALFLPRAALLRDISSPVTFTSRDRPQHPFIEALTANPVSTLTSICAGTAICMGWWGGWVRDWWIAYSLTGSDDEKQLDKTVLNEKKVKVCRFPNSL